MSGILNNANNSTSFTQQNKNGTGQEGGWDFWTRVYETPDLRNMMRETTQNDASLSELLQSSSLSRAQLQVSNVPKLADSQQNVVRSLLQKELRTQVPILDVRIDNRKWLIRFYRAEDALRALRAFEGHTFRGKVLTASIGDIVATEPTRPIVEPETDQRNVNWFAAEWEDIMAFKKDVVQLVSSSARGFPLPEVLSELTPMRRRGVVPAAIDCWPTGLVRIFHPQVRMTGSYLSLADHNITAQLMRRVASEGAPRSLREEWEPHAAFEIRSNHQLVEYLCALLTNFGPQHLEIDLPIRILATILPSTWPRSAAEIAKTAVGLSAHFIVVDDVLYLASNVRNRRILLEHLQPQVVPVPPRPKHFNFNGNSPVKKVEMKLF